MKITGSSPPPTNISRPGLIPQYLRRALGQHVANKLLGYFTLKDGQYVDHNYSSLTNAYGTRAQKFPGQKNPPLILTSVKGLDELLSFYPVRVEAFETERYRQRFSQSESIFLAAAQSSPWRQLNFLNNFPLVVKPNGKLVFICDDHPHVVYGLALARQLGLIDSAAQLFHVDEHLDNTVNSQLHKKMGGSLYAPPALPVIAGHCKTELRIDEHHAYACRCGLVQPGNIHYVLTKDLPGLRSEGTEPAGKKIFLVERQRVVPSAAPDLALQLGQTVLDLDLDFFVYLHDPLFLEEEKALLKGWPEKKSLPIVKTLAQNAAVVLIAISPDYFGVPPEKIKALILSIVAAA